FVDARSRRDGADLHAAVDAAIERSAQRTRAGLRSEPPGAAALIVIAVLCAAPARAEEAPGADAAASPAQVTNAQDDKVRGDIDTILGQREFREFADSDSRSLRDLFERLFRWLDQLQHEQHKDRENSSTHSIEISPWVLIAIVLIALSVIAIYIARARQTRPWTSGAA